MGGGSQTTTQKADPWAPSQPFLIDAMGDASDIYNQGGFAIDPYPNSRVAGFGDVSNIGQGAIVNQAMQGAPLVGQASNTLSGMMDYDRQSGLLDDVKQNALGSAIPAAMSQFAGSGMANSGMAMDTVGRAATQAVAPYEYGAHENTMNRMMGAAGMSPQIEQAGYMPGQMMQGVGMLRDNKAQQQIDADMQQYYEGQNKDINAINNYSQLLMGYGGQGGTQTGTTTQKAGPFGMIGGGLQMAGLTKMLFPSLFASDRRLKRDIVKIGRTPKGVNIYSFKYAWGDTEQIGVMSDEVPHAVAGQIGGYDLVDYSRIS